MTGTLVIGQATPTLTWAQPGNITVGTPLGAGQLDAIASFNGVPLAGVLTYSRPAGTVLPIGNGQTLTVSFTPTDGTDFKTVSASVPINVLPQPTPPPGDDHQRAACLPAQAQQEGQTRRQGGSDGIHARASTCRSARRRLSNRSNYELDSVTIKKVKKNLERVAASDQDLHRRVHARRTIR